MDKMAKKKMSKTSVCVCVCEREREEVERRVERESSERGERDGGRETHRER